MKSVKNLGVIFNDTLTWTNQINSAVGKIYGMLRNLWPTHSFTPISTRKLIANAYLMPCLLYGCEVFANSDAISKRKLNVAYNNIIRYVFGLSRYAHISQYATKLHGTSFDNLLKIRCLQFLHKIIYERQPTYLYERLVFARSNRGNKLVSFKCRYLTSEWQFFIAVTRLWNQLPNQLQINSNAIMFRRKLENFYGNNN